ncbi:uroporphyrinogen-III synthase [Novosphingobium sp. EMRT-2]|uniref:uroporphyrinogen-III synthase n=1 Tax=Novosphingobium sp. EMRT-2 TaxID=2571749 RepID=UPI0010BD1FDE|nr:uroporphyrinogen-III synthase [Novosphingobium sp. EMRT-2]QCI94928.1 uroporphyrinogen-III synthase [Novosphingobium sp. EMRT-2]
MASLPLIVIRPEPGNRETVDRARAMGIDTYGFPLFEVAPLPWDAPSPAGFTGLLAGSANVFRHGGARLEQLRALPVHAVGATTADAARAAGFQVAEAGTGGLQPMVERLAAGRYLRLAGEERVPLLPPAGVSLETRVVYAVGALAFPPALRAILREGAVVALHSGEAARHFAQETTESNMNRHAISIACLAPRIAKMAREGWRKTGIAPERTDHALLALAFQMCQTV